MKYTPINLQEKFSKFTAQWEPKIVAKMNDYHLKLARIQGDFTWHSHPKTDETFIVVEGAMRIDFRDGTVTLQEGEMFVVPKGAEHKPYAEKECRIILIEPAGTTNTGDAGGEKTAQDNAWV